MKALLYRTFVTNWKTTAGGLLCLLAVGLFLARLIQFTEMIALLGTGAGWAGLAAKDGTRTDTPVAREDLPTHDPS